MIKLLLGGSPCTHWSIAQTKNRETEPSGIGWELFENYLIALDKFQPDYFLYENNKSMSKSIREEITKRFGFEPICLNSALVSAQNRQRLYWCGKRNQDGTYSQVEVEQPEDKGILLRDILETGVCWREKAYTLDANYNKTAGVYNPEKQHSRRLIVAEPVSTTKDGKSYTLKASYAKSSVSCSISGGHFPAPMAAEPVRIGTIESKTSGKGWDSKQYRVYSPDGKSVTLCGQGVCAAPVRVGDMPNSNGEIKNRQSGRIYSVDEKSVALQARPNGGGADGASTGLYAVPMPGKEAPVYEVKNGLIAIKGKQYPIKLADGFYIIRKLTVTECKRLQTVPDSYDFPVSDTQAYKMLGNGWTVDVIAHLLLHIQGITTEPVDVLSMYDGMACGHIALDKLGAHIQRYRATEIDKYAVKTACYNFPDIEQIWDAFQVREW